MEEEVVVFIVVEGELVVLVPKKGLFAKIDKICVVLIILY